MNELRFSTRWLSRYFEKYGFDSQNLWNWFSLGKTLIKMAFSQQNALHVPDLYDSLHAKFDLVSSIFLPPDGSLSVQCHDVINLDLNNGGPKTRT